MANFNAVKEMDKKFKEVDKTIEELENNVNALNSQINELEQKRDALAVELVKEVNAKEQLTKFAEKLDKFNGDMDMMNYLFLGFMVSNGMQTTDEIEEKKEEVVSTLGKHKKYSRRTKEEISEFKKWKATIHEACDGSPENVILHRAYNYIRKVYGLVFEQEKKEFFEANERNPINTMELLYWVETNKPVYENILLTGVFAVIDGKDVECGA